MNQIIKTKAIRNTFIKNLNIYKYPIPQLNTILQRESFNNNVIWRNNFQFCKDNKKPKSNDQEKQHSNKQTKSSIDQQYQKKFTQMQEKEAEDLITSEQNTQNYKIIARKYNQTKVPGLQTRKYSDLSKLQQQVVQSNKFDLFNPEIIPKTGAINSYVGINQQLTQISLGSVKVKGKNQAFLSQIDPQNIPADLDIRFDKQKQLKVVGKQTNNQQNLQNPHSQNPNQLQMKIQPQTIQQRTMNQHMQQQFGIGVKGYQYSNWKNYRRWDIFLTILCFSLLVPILQTFNQLNQCYQTTKAIQQERMKQIVLLKQRSFQKVLFQNKDFNNSKRL